MTLYCLPHHSNRIKLIIPDCVHRILTNILIFHINSTFEVPHVKSRSVKARCLSLRSAHAPSGRHAIHHWQNLFRSGKCRQKPLTIMAVSRMIKFWSRAINLPGKYGAHFLRKAFGYTHRPLFGVGFERICKRFNHSSPSVTMRYWALRTRKRMKS